MIEVYSQTRTEMPEALVVALNPDTLASINIQPIPVRLSKAPPGDSWAGFCLDAAYAEVGEIVISTAIVEPCVRQPNPRLVLDVYLHECAHRLLGVGHSHNAAFFALNLMLNIRAGKPPAMRYPLWLSLDLYSIQDEIERLPQAFSWAWKTAHEYARSDKSAEQAAKEIAERYERWSQAFQNPDGKSPLQKLREQLKQQQAARWYFYCYGVVTGLVATATLIVKLI